MRHALCHRAGVPATREPLSNDDLWHWERMTSALAATNTWWEPGTRHAYHTNTYGHLIGELVHRTTTGELFRGPGCAAVGGGTTRCRDLLRGVPGRQAGRCAEVLWESGDVSPGLIGSRAT